MAEQGAEWFRGTSSWVWGVLGLIATAVVIVFDALDGLSLAVLVGALIFGVLCYVAIIRPQVGVEGGDLVLRHMYSTQRVPITSVESVAIRRTFTATAGGRSYVSPAIGRSPRELRRRARRDGATNYADFVEERVAHRAAEAREQATFSTDAAAVSPPATGVRRDWAWAWITLTGVLIVAFVVALLV